MKNILFLLLLLVSCQKSVQDGRAPRSAEGTGSPEKDDARRCMPSDTTLSNGFSLLHKGDTASFTLILKYGANQKDMNYAFDCSIGSVYIPQVASSGTGFVELMRGCGSGCRKSMFVLLQDNLRINEYENIIALDEKTPLAAIQKEDSVFIFNPLNKQGKSYRVQYEGNSIFEDCDSSELNSKQLYMRMYDGKEIRINLD